MFTSYILVCTYATLASCNIANAIQVYPAGEAKNMFECVYKQADAYRAGIVLADGEAIKIVCERSETPTRGDRIG